MRFFIAIAVTTATLGGVLAASSGADSDPAAPSVAGLASLPVADANGNDLVCAGRVVTAADVGLGLAPAELAIGHATLEPASLTVAPLEEHAGPWFSFACVNGQVVARPGP